jgi:hypothetical protein
MDPFPNQKALDSLSEISQELPAVRNLFCPGSTQARSFSIRATPVARNELYTRMSAQPGSQCLSSPVWQERQWAAPLEVVEERAIPTTTSPGKIVNAE